MADGPCICDLASGGVPCSSPRCIWLGDAIDIPPQSPGERAEISGLAAAQPAQIAARLSYIAQRYGTGEAVALYMRQCEAAIIRAHGVPPMQTGTTNAIHYSGSGGELPTGGGGGGSCVSASRRVPIHVPERADPAGWLCGPGDYVDLGYGPVPVASIPRAPQVTPGSPRDPSWQEIRKTWLDTGDMSALTAMDQYDPAAMSGDDWLGCDEYDAKRARVPELAPPSRSYRLTPAMFAVVVFGLLMGWLLAVLIAHGALPS